MSSFQSADFAERAERIEGVDVKVTSYRLGQRFSAQVKNEDGAIIGRASAEDRKSAEAEALESASVRLGLQAATESFRRSLNHLQQASRITGGAPGRTKPS